MLPPSSLHRWICRPQQVALIEDGRVFAMTGMLHDYDRAAALRLTTWTLQE
jgi:hypothetical protein